MKPVSIMAVKDVGFVRGPETDISTVGDPELLKEPVTAIGVYAKSYFKDSG